MTADQRQNYSTLSISPLPSGRIISLEKVKDIMKTRMTVSSSLLIFLPYEETFTSTASLTLSALSLISPLRRGWTFMDFYFQSFCWLCENKLHMVALSFFLFLLVVKVPLEYIWSFKCFKRYILPLGGKIS